LAYLVSESLEEGLRGVAETASGWAVPAMSEPVPHTNGRSRRCQALTVGQLARRWAISAKRVRELVLGGHLPGAFTIPSAGRFGATLKIPVDTVLKVETEDWAVVPQPAQARPKPRRRGDSGPALRHFPSLATDQDGDGSPGAVPG
jgi:hypothetical protein